MDPARQTTEYLQERLIEEETYLQADSEERAALSATVKKGGKGGAKNSKSKKNGNKRPRHDKKDVECYRCHQKGHIARNCTGDKQCGSDFDRLDSHDYVLVVACSKHESDKLVLNLQSSTAQVRNLMRADIANIWLSDSGASAHMSKRLVH